MSNIQAALRILAKKKYPITEIVHDINELVYFNYKGEKFVTFFLAHYNLEDNSIQYINCGHNGPIFYQENKGFTLLEEGTVPLGAFEQIHSLSKGHIQDIKGKSILFSYTDGLVEAFDSMDTNRSLDIIKNCILQTKQEWKLNAEVLDKLQIKSNNFDDITILSCFVNHV
jgi:sigma-B regulation protein RsbU (phosphoserine phosphatase)